MKQLTALFLLLGIALLLNNTQPLFAADGAAGMEVPSSATAGLPDKAASHNDQGIKLFIKGEYGAALLEFNRALAEDPSNPTVLINRGVAFAKRGQYSEAIENFYYALDFDNNNIAALKHLAAAYLLAGDAGKAVDVYNKIAAIDPSDFLIYIKRGAANAALGRHDRAIADFSRTIYLHPNFYKAYINRGISFTASGKTDFAVSDFDTALRASSKDPLIYLSRSDAYSKKGNFKDALADLNKACSLGYRQVCDAVKQAKAEIAGTESSFALKYSNKTPDEELYAGARKKLDSFISNRQRSEVQKFILSDMHPLALEKWSLLLADNDKTMWSTQPSGVSSCRQGIVTVRTRFQPEEGSPLYIRIKEILKSDGKPYEQYRFSEDTFEINCKHNKIRATSNREFDLNGVMIDSGNKASGWFDVAPGSAAESMCGNFCR